MTDATCILTGQGWLYLVAVLDVYTRRIIGWAMHQILDARLLLLIPVTADAGDYEGTLTITAA